MPSLDEGRCRRLVRGSRAGTLCTVDGDGRPSLVPFVFALSGDILYSAVDRKPKTTPRLRRLENIRERPDHVSVLVDHYEEDWTRLWWVRMGGRGRIVEAEESERALKLLAQKYEQYGAAPPTGPVIAIDVAEWRGWSARPIE